MKRKKRGTGGKDNGCHRVNLKLKKRSSSNDEKHLNDMLKMCLSRILQLQDDLQREEHMKDAEAEGYAACAMETLRFLSNQGLPQDHPMVKELTEKLSKERT